MSLRAKWRSVPTTGRDDQDLPLGPDHRVAGQHHRHLLRRHPVRKAPGGGIEKTRILMEAGVKPEIAVYTDADVDNARRYLIESGLLEEPLYWVVLPALPGGSPMHNPRQMIQGLTRIVDSIFDINPNSIISVCAAGRPSVYLVTLGHADGTPRPPRNGGHRLALPRTVTS